jgi:hypothetical protein
VFFDHEDNADYFSFIKVCELPFLNKCRHFQAIDGVFSTLTHWLPATHKCVGMDKSKNNIITITIYDYCGNLVVLFVITQ